MVKSGFDMENVLGWRDGILLFRHSDLPEIAQKLERWYGAEVTIRNPSGKQFSIDARFKNESLLNVLDGISYAGNLSYTKQQNRIFLMVP
jgi:ferric-dicitrate binding protein FerR (iron transport regulator)